MSQRQIDAFELAPASIADERALVALMSAFNKAEGIAWQPGPMGDALRRLLAQPALGIVLLARERASGESAGYALATFGYDIEYGGLDAFVTELFVAPGYRCRGLGRFLLEAIISQVRQHGANAVHLMVRPDNTHARALYERLGFETAPRLMMTKRLDAGRL